MPDGLYDRDILQWSERQAALLRRLADGERLNEAPDWPNLIEEIESVGRSELHACESLLEQALSHLVKLSLEPGSPAVDHWRGEVMTFLARARRMFSPSMRQRLDVDGLYDDVLEAARTASDRKPLPLPARCPFTLDVLLATKPDIDGLVAALGDDARL